MEKPAYKGKGYNYESNSIGATFLKMQSQSNVTNCIMQRSA